jgi:hypothetical protein
MELNFSIKVKKRTFLHYIIQRYKNSVSLCDEVAISSTCSKRFNTTDSVAFYFLSVVLCSLSFPKWALLLATLGYL